MSELEQEIERRGLGNGRKQMLALAGVVAVGSAAYRLIVHHHLEQTSVLFIGLPTLLAMLLVIAPPAKTMVGGVMKGIAFMLLLSGPLLGEGFVCILMASPIFLLVGLVVAVIAQNAKRDRGLAVRCCLLVLLPMSLEGTSDRLSFGRSERVEATAVVAGSESEVRERMARSPRVALGLPVYLKMGFPRPEWAVGDGLAVGDLRTIHFVGGEGMPGDLVMRVTGATVRSARFEVASDGCEGMHSLGHWVKLRESEVRWEAVDAGHTRVTWAIAYDRKLDPAWYFGPWERYGVGLAARYLIDANAGGQ